MGALETLREEDRQLGIGPSLQELLQKNRVGDSSTGPSGRVRSVRDLDSGCVRGCSQRLDCRAALGTSQSAKPFVILRDAAAPSCSFDEHRSGSISPTSAGARSSPTCSKRIRAMFRNDSAFRRVGSISVGSEEHWSLAVDDDLAVFGLPVVTAKEIGDGPDTGGEVRIAHRIVKAAARGLSLTRREIRRE